MDDYSGGRLPPAPLALPNFNSIASEPELLELSAALLLDELDCSFTSDVQVSTEA
jgi:hypothetical protein